MIGGVSGLITFFLSTTILQYFRLFGVLLNAGVVLVTFFALCSDKKNTFAFAAVYGVLVDFYASRFLGINLLLYIVIAFVVLRLVETLYKESITLPYLLYALSTFVYYLGYVLFMAVFRMILPFSELFRVFLIELIYNVSVGIGIYYLYSRIMKGRNA